MTGSYPEPDVTRTGSYLWQEMRLRSLIIRGYLTVQYIHFQLLLDGRGLCGHGRHRADLRTVPVNMRQTSVCFKTLEHREKSLSEVLVHEAIRNGMDKT